MILNYTKSLKEAEATARAVRAAGAEAAIAQGDVAEDADCRRIAGAAGRFGRLDALVNNAGITKHVQNHADLDALSKEDFLRLYAVNTVGPFQMIRACRALLEAGRAVERADDLLDRGRDRHRLVGRLRRLQGRAQHHDAVARPRAGAQDPRQRHLPGLHRHALVHRWLRRGARRSASASNIAKTHAAEGGLEARGHRRRRAVPHLGCGRATSPARP